MLTSVKAETYLATRDYTQPPVVPGPDLENTGADFEAIFVRQMMEELLPKDGAFFGSGPGSKMFQSMFINAVADEVAPGGMFGIKDLIEREYREREDAVTAPPPNDERPPSGNAGVDVKTSSEDTDRSVPPALDVLL